MFQLATPVAGDAYPVVDPDMSILEYADIFEKKFRDGLFSADNMQFMEFVITESTGQDLRQGRAGPWPVSFAARPV